jgi:hypothetical protein
MNKISHIQLFLLIGDAILGVKDCVVLPWQFDDFLHVYFLLVALHITVSGGPEVVKEEVLVGSLRNVWLQTEGDEGFKVLGDGDVWIEEVLDGNRGY